MTQKEVRNFTPEFKSAKEMGIDDETRDKQKKEIELFTVKNRSDDRLDSPEGNPFLIADFFHKKLSENTKYRNTAVREMTFQKNKAVRFVRGVKGEDGDKHSDFAALNNLRNFLNNKKGF